MKRALLVVLGFVAFFLAAPVFAETAGRVALRAASGSLVELSLGPDGEQMVGEFFLRNEGSEPIEISRVAVRTSPADPRTPPGLSVDVQGLRLNANLSLKPGEERRAAVKWRISGARARELYGQIVVESSARGSDEPGRALAIGVHAERARGLGPLGARALSLIVFLPLIGALFALVLRLLRRDTPRALALSSALVHGANLAFVVTIAALFDRGFGRADGNDGYQFIERGVLSRSLGVEYFLGVDGISLALVLGVAALALVASLASLSLGPRAASFHVFAGLFVTSALGALVALDLALFAAFLLLGVLPACLLVARAEHELARRASLRLLIASLASAALFCAAVHWLWTYADPTYLSSGDPTRHSFAIPELSRVAWVGKEARLFGRPLVEVLWAALFSAFMLRLAAFPFPGFSAEVFAAAEAPASVLLAGIFRATGIYGLLRLGVGVLPDGLRWASTTVAALGVITLFVSSLAALAEPDLKRFFARSSGAHLGFALLGIGAATPQGFEASVFIGATSGLVVGLPVLLAGVLEARAKDRGLSLDLSRLGGLTRAMPTLALLFGVATLASLGAPLTAGFWGPLLSLFGAFARFRVLAVLGALGALFVAGAHLFALANLLFGEKRAEEDVSDIRRPELLSVAPLVIFVLALGIAPRPLLGLADASCLELHQKVDRPGPSQIS